MTRVWTAKIISYPFNYICQPVLTPVDIGKQISQQNWPRFPLIKKFTPTRIPSPVWNATIKDRHVSIPVLPSQKSHKEVSPLNNPLHICQMEMFIIECILRITTTCVFLPIPNNLFRMKNRRPRDPKMPFLHRISLCFIFRSLGRLEYFLILLHRSHTPA